MTQVIKVAKIGKDIRSTDPNDFIFHSDYNTFKIIQEATKSITLAASTANQTFTQAHNLEHILPLVSAFAKRSGVSQVFAPNGFDVETYGAKAGYDGDVRFNYVASDETNVIFNFDNDKVTTVDVSIRYFLLEHIL